MLLVVIESVSIHGAIGSQVGLVDVETVGVTKKSGSTVDDGGLTSSRNTGKTAGSVLHQPSGDESLELSVIVETEDRVESGDERANPLKGLDSFLSTLTIAHDVVEVLEGSANGLTHGGGRVASITVLESGHGGTREDGVDLKLTDGIEIESDGGSDVVTLIVEELNEMRGSDGIVENVDTVKVGRKSAKTNDVIEILALNVGNLLDEVGSLVTHDGSKQLDVVGGVVDGSQGRNVSHVTGLGILEFALDDVSELVDLGLSDEVGEFLHVVGM